MAVVTAKHVANAFSSAIADLMSKGYIISPFTEDGSYNSTKTHVDMIKPNDNSHILRVWMIDEYHKVGDRWWRHIDTVGVRVKKYDKGKSFDGNVCKEQHMWPDNGELIYEKLFYMFKTCRSHNRPERNVYSTSFEEANALSDLAWNRLNNSCVRDGFYHNGWQKIELTRLSAKFIDLIMKRINSIRGFKRASASCIKSVEMSRGERGRLIAHVKYSLNSKNGTITLG